MLTFPDNTQIRVIGLVEILADLYAEGRPANEVSAEVIIDRLEAKKNYIPSSDHARKEYAYVLMREYRKFVASQTKDR
jgi:hypothetical protein